MEKYVSMFEFKMLYAMNQYDFKYNGISKRIFIQNIYSTYHLPQYNSRSF